MKQYQNAALSYRPGDRATVETLGLGTSEDLGAPQMGSLDMIGLLLIVLGVILGELGSLMH
jgi:hypothetical protein